MYQKYIKTNNHRFVLGDFYYFGFSGNKKRVKIAENINEYKKNVNITLFLSVAFHKKSWKCQLFQSYFCESFG